MGKHLVLAGAGHAHMTTLVNLRDYIEKGHRVTVISLSEYHYYSGMGPGMLSGFYRPREIRFHIKKTAEDRGALFIKDKVVRIAPEDRRLILAGGGEVFYDVASFNTGSGVPVEPLAAPNERVIPVKPIINLYHARLSIMKEIKEKELQIAVVGGGPAGVEIAANLWKLVADSGGRARISLIGGERLLKDAPQSVRRYAIESLTARGVEVLESVRAESIKDGRISLRDEESLPYDYAFIATGVRPSSLFRDSGLPSASDGAMIVDRHLRSIARPELFGGGDCVEFKGHSLAKVGVYAVRENPILHYNLMAVLDGRRLEAFDPGGSYMLIMNMGNGKGIAWKNNWVIEGRISFLLKNYIDKRFMRKFQTSGELQESNEE